jgi:hypothetical protein
MMCRRAAPDDARCAQRLNASGEGVPVKHQVEYQELSDPARERSAGASKPL